MTPPASLSVQMPAGNRRLSKSSSNLAPVASMLLTLFLFAAFLRMDIYFAMAVPLCLLMGLVSHHLFRLILNPSCSDVFSPVTLVAVYFGTYFALRAFVLGTVPFFGRLGRNAYDDYLPIALWCACVGYVSFLAGISSDLPKGWARRLQRGPVSWPSRMPAARVVILILIGFACLLYLFKIGVSVGSYGNREFQRHPPPGLVVLLRGLLDLSWVAVCVFLIVPGERSNRGVAYLVLGLSIFSLAINLAISGGKVSIIQPLLEAAIVVHYGRRRLRIWEIAAVGVPVLLVAFGIVNFYRFVVIGQRGAPKDLGDVISRVSSSSDLLASGQGSAAKHSALEQMVGRDAGIDALALVIKYTPHPFPYAYGWDFLQAPLTFVPRQIWKDKPISLPSADFETAYMGEPRNFNGFSSIHVISDLYRNFSIFGVIGGMFAFGVVLRTFYLLCAPSRDNGAGVFFYATLFPEFVHSLEADVSASVVGLIRVGILVLSTAAFLGVQYRRVHASTPLRKGTFSSGKMVAGSRSQS